MGPGSLFSKTGSPGFETWGQTESFLMFLFARIKDYRKRSVCPQVPKVSKSLSPSLSAQLRVWATRPFRLTFAL